MIEIGESVSKSNYFLTTFYKTSLPDQLMSDYLGEMLESTTYDT